MHNDTQILRECMASVEIDITPDVYTTFFATAPEAREHMGIVDERMRGRMLDQVYQLLLGETDGEYLAFETRTHRSYGANPDMYRALFGAVRDTVKDALGDNWTTREQDAWNRSIDRIVDEIERVP